ncbi:hypothetical protein FHR83_004615 [Actinoplanes campanulatus]|uniref:Copper(I)-binding protein n=1 Tax=Actinoplanes campanulatus TaxID=113559 RepID=A0A7W5FG11_9ACTN|nr:hypothetical protein [Actinoplanes campanulatus]MBB3096940.1 hypothetical protein [Actinoplanes campanulatus]GGN14577.1 hypothetical protein GCM10010109_26010 [Actinoplanes campanulatus]GID37876.1 hypothetical protein Aca09nite_43820 [Actinoplanes campanulatus]
MRPLGTRRAALVAGAATVAALALGGCSAGQVAETAILDTPIAGVDTETADGSVFIRNLQVEYNGIEGYEKGENAPLDLSLFNQTAEPVTVTITSAAPDLPQVVGADQVGFVSAAATVTTPGEVAASPSVAPSASALAATVRPARIQIAPLSAATFRSTDLIPLQVIGLQGALTPGASVNLVFEFSNSSEKLVLQAPVASPLSPAPRGPAVVGEDTPELESH